MAKATKFLSTAALSLCVVSAPAAVQAEGYGCFVVTASAINIRARPYSWSKVVGTASKGDILTKRKLWCTPRGFWCAVQKGDLKGYADKSFMKKITNCP